MAGLGFSSRLYEVHDQLLSAARELVLACPCQQGCPACVGPVLENGSVQLPTKQLTHALIDALLGQASNGQATAAWPEIAFME
jgi:DEAD/DEAH box helicase domain-containing protein